MYGVLTLEVGLCSGLFIYTLTTPSDLESSNQTFRLENFTYSNNAVMTTIFGHVARSNFTGVTVSNPPTG